MNDERFDRDLRAVLDDLAPAEVPGPLRDAVTDVPRTAPVRRVAAPAIRSRFAMLGLAAAVVIVVAGIAALSGGRFGGIVAGGPTPSPAAIEGPWNLVTYQVLGSARLMAPTPADIAEVMTRVGSRLATVGADYRVEATDGGFRVWLRGDNLARLRQLIGTTGLLEFVPLGQTPAQAGENMDLVANPPLFANDGIVSAAVGTNQTGQRTVDITLSPAATELFATFTRDHVGDYFAIVLDGKVMTAPVIQETITGGQVQVSQSGVSGYPLAGAEDLVAIVGSGALLFPVSEVGNQILGPSDTPHPPAPTAATPVPSPLIASPSPLPSPIIPAASSSPAAVTGPWSGLAVESLPGSPAEVTQAVAWAHGYVGIGPQDAASPTGGWASADGRAWTPWPAGMFGLSVATGRGLVGVAPCRGSVVALVASGGAVEAHVTSDGQVWTATRLDKPAGANPPYATPTLAGGAGGAVVASVKGGTTLFVTTDCASWQQVTLPGPANTAVTGVAALGNGFVATGFSGGTAAVGGGIVVARFTADNRSNPTTARAWWSPDGVTWSAAEVTAPAGDGFQLPPLVGSAGMVAVMGTPGTTPGQETLWASTDGRSWHAVRGPLGTRVSGEGVGSVTGTFSGDGTRILVYGDPNNAGGSPEYWTSSGDGTWTKLAITGSGAAAVTDPNQAGSYVPVLLRDGVLFGGADQVWSFGSAVGR